VKTTRFATTHWSLVLAAGGTDPVAGEEALSRLCSLYWYPVFAFIRRQGYSPEDAQDLTQGFFTRMLEKREIGHADRDRGRFRSFLLTACSHFLSNERDRVQTIKRGGFAFAVPVDVIEAEGRYERALVTTDTPERHYERQWARTLLASVLDTLRREYGGAGNERLFDRLSVFIADPGGSYAGAARDLDMTLPAVKMAIHRLRRRYRDALTERVADTVDSPDEVEDEIRHLMDAVRM